MFADFLVDVRQKEKENAKNQKEKVNICNKIGYWLLVDVRSLK